MRKLAAAAVAGLMIATGGAVALAAAVRSDGAARSVLKPGSKKHPQGVRLSTTFGWGGLPRSREPIVTGFDLWFPKGSQYNGSRYPHCSQKRLARGGPAGCPSGSIMGSGSGIAYAAQTITRPKITVVNGGAREVFFYVVMNNPARVREPVVGHLKRISGKFVYHLSVKIPKNLQIVAGVPIKLTSLHITAGKRKWLAITAAPAGVEVETTYSTGFQTSYLVWVQDS
jgi:hypothetical protein